MMRTYWHLQKPSGLVCSKSVNENERGGMRAPPGRERWMTASPGPIRSLKALNSLRPCPVLLFLFHHGSSKQARAGIPNAGNAWSGADRARHHMRALTPAVLDKKCCRASRASGGRGAAATRAVSRGSTRPGASLPCLRLYGFVEHQQISCRAGMEQAAGRAAAPRCSGCRWQSYLLATAFVGLFALRHSLGCKLPFMVM